MVKLVCGYVFSGKNDIFYFKSKKFQTNDIAPLL